MIRTLSIVFLLLYGTGITGWSQHLPKVFGNQRSDVIEARLNHQAALAFQRFPPPTSLEEWMHRKTELRNRIIELSGIQTFSDLDLDYRETGQVEIEGGVVKMIYFQTRPGVYATANLYVPHGDGPFPGVITMMGHSSDGKLYDVYRAVGYELVRNGYVSLHIDPWGAGERTTTHGKFEYHGAHLGAALLNVGETLLGMQLTDNMRGVDLLSSLPYIDASKIGATGASGGGNQTMWLAAMDDRVKASMPVVSVGTFESYVMSSNCVCEMLPGGLEWMEESEVLGLVAPRALRVCNAENESNQAFFPSEMMRSLDNARTIFDLYEAADNLQYQIGNTTHGYHPLYRESLIGWMDLHLKGEGDGTPHPTKEYDIPERESMMVWAPGNRPNEVMNTVDYYAEMESQHATLEPGKAGDKRIQLRDLLRLPDDKYLGNVHHFGVDGGWHRYALETTDGYFIPVLIKPPASSNGEFVMVAHTEGKDNVPYAKLQEWEQAGMGICLVDFWGMGESGSAEAQKKTGSHLPAFHTLSRSLMWLGQTMQGVWVREMEVVTSWLEEEFAATEILMYANKDLALSSLFFNALNPGHIQRLEVENVPVSYAFGPDITGGFFTMGIHIPGFLKWGNVAMVTALSTADIRIHQPRNLDGTPFTHADEFQNQVARLKRDWGTAGVLDVDQGKY